MFYYRNGTFNNDEWSYSESGRKYELLAKYPNTQIYETSLVTHMSDVINICVRI
jgi:hypothetical protein